MANQWFQQQLNSMHFWRQTN